MAEGCSYTTLQPLLLLFLLLSLLLLLILFYPRELYKLYLGIRIL